MFVASVDTCDVVERLSHRQQTRNPPVRNPGSSVILFEHSSALLRHSFRTLLRCSGHIKTYEHPTSVAGKTEG